MRLDDAPDPRRLNLAVLAYAQGHTSWHYRARAELLADVLAVGYFDGLADMLEAGDTVMVSALDAGATLYVHAAAPGRADLEVMSRSGPGLPRQRACHGACAAPPGGGMPVGQEIGMDAGAAD